jgi:hypothetical protein
VRSSEPPLGAVSDRRAALADAREACCNDLAVKLIDELEQRIASETSPFRAQLLREDVVRLRKLDEIARSAADVEAYRRAARRLGWTAEDARTGELGGALDRLLDAVHDAARGSGGETSIRDAWLDLWRVRMERLVGCLSTPVPKPDG